VCVCVGGGGAVRPAGSPARQGRSSPASGPAAQPAQRSLPSRPQGLPAPTWCPRSAACSRRRWTPAGAPAAAQSPRLGRASCARPGSRPPGAAQEGVCVCVQGIIIACDCTIRSLRPCRGGGWSSSAPGSGRTGAAGRGKGARWSAPPPPPPPPPPPSARASRPWSHLGPSAHVPELQVIAGGHAGQLGLAGVQRAAPQLLQLARRHGGLALQAGTRAGRHQLAWSEPPTPVG
jgi:hypothetical protein